MTKEDLIKEAFHHLNSFKRHRALMEVNNDKRYHELKTYKHIDGLELTMRAIQKDQREVKN